MSRRCRRRRWHGWSRRCRWHGRRHHCHLPLLDWGEWAALSSTVRLGTFLAPNCNSWATKPQTQSGLYSATCVIQYCKCERFGFVGYLPYPPPRRPSALRLSQLTAELLRREAPPAPRRLGTASAPGLRAACGGKEARTREGRRSAYMLESVWPGLRMSSRCEIADARPVATKPNSLRRSGGTGSGAEAQPSEGPPSEGGPPS